MTLNEIRKLLNTEDGMVELINRFTPYFTEINRMENKLFDEALDIVEARKMLQEITSYNLKINKACILVEEKIDINEIEYLAKQQKKAEKYDEKFSVQASKREARNKMIYEKRILNNFKIYLKNSDKLTFVLQSISKSLIEESVRLSN